MSATRFLPPEGQSDIMIALKSGHTCRVYSISPKDGEVGTAIPDKFHRPAIARGCEIVGIKLGKESKTVDDLAEEDKPKGIEDMIREAYITILENEIPEQLDDNGKPKLAAVSEVAGFTVNRNTASRVWNKLMAELKEEAELPDTDTDDE